MTKAIHANHVAWCRYKQHGDRPTTIHLCDCTDDGAFPVYRQPTPAMVTAIKVCKALVAWEDHCERNPDDDDDEGYEHLCHAAEMAREAVKQAEDGVVDGF